MCGEQSHKVALELQSEEQRAGRAEFSDGFLCLFLSQEEKKVKKRHSFGLKETFNFRFGSSSLV